MPLQTVVVDDEAPARDELIYMLSEIDDIVVSGQAASGKKALKLVKEERPDVVFLDIQMLGMSGLEVSRRLITSQEIIPKIVFVTAYDEYAIEAFELNAVDYLLKPFSEERLQKTIQRLIVSDEDYLLTSKINNVLSCLSESVNKIPVDSEKGRIKLITSEDINVAFTENGEVFVKTKQGRFRVNFTLKKLEQMIDKSYFFRCHRGFLVNLNQVEEIVPWFKGKYTLILAGEDKLKIPVGRTKADELKRRLNI